MAEYTKKEFAEIIQKETNYLSVQIQRKKVVLNKGGKIDTDNPTNRAYLEKMYGRADLAPKPIPAKRDSPPSTRPARAFMPDDAEDISDDMTMDDLLNDPNRKNLPYPELERIYKYLQGKKIEKEIEKNNLDIEKKKGTVVPSELIKPVFLQHNQFIVTEFKNAVDEIIRVISKKKSLSVNETAEIRSELVPCINNAIDKATISSISNISALITDFSEKKGVGERA